MKNFFEELRKNGLAPILMSGCAGFLIGTIVMGLVFHSWQTPKLIESASATDDLDAEEYSEITKEETDFGYYQVTKNADLVREKLTSVDEAHVWANVKEDLAQDIDLNLVITKDQLDSAKSGQILAIKKIADQNIIISVPEIFVDGKKNNDFDKYGVVQVFTLESYYLDNYYARTALHFYDKTQLSSESPLIFYGEGCWCITSPIPYAPDFGVISKEEFDASDDPGVYTATPGYYYQFGCGTSGPAGEDASIKFSKTWMSFDSGAFNKIEKLLYKSNLGHRKTVDACWNSDKSSYDLLGLFDFNSGKFAGELELVRVDSNLYYIDEGHFSNCLIVLQPKEITIVTSDSSVIRSEEEELWIGSYYKDTTNSSDLVKIEGTDLTLSRATIEALLSLLNENGVDWWIMRPSSIVTE